VLGELDHPSVVKLDKVAQSSLTNSQLSETSSSDSKSLLCATEFAKFGSFEQAFGQNLPSERVLKFYFWQALKGLQYIHSQGCYHLDIKPCNLLLDEALDLKLADFGFAVKASVIAGSPGPVTSNKMSGTLGFRAPEVTEGSQYLPAKADIWSLAAAMFRIFTRRCPFPKGAVGGDPYWKYVVSNKKKMFFGSHHQHVYKVNPEFRCFDKNFQDLMFDMWNPVPEQRPEISEILGREFFAGVGD